jgi:hypothetical protein
MEFKTGRDVFDSLTALLQEASPVITKEISTYLSASCQKNIETNYYNGINAKKLDSSIPNKVEANLDRLTVFSDSFITNVCWYHIHTAGRLAHEEGSRIQKLKEVEDIQSAYKLIDQQSKEVLDLIINKAGFINQKIQFLKKEKQLDDDNAIASAVQSLLIANDTKLTADLSAMDHLYKIIDSRL